MISAKPWSLEAVARLFLGVIVTLFLGTIVASLSESKKLGLAQDQREFFQIIVMVAFFQGAALIWIAVFLRQSNLSWREAFGLRPNSRARVVASGLAIGLLILPAMWFLQMVSQVAMEWLKFKPVAQAAVEELQKSGMSVLEKTLFAGFTILLAPVAEEVLFRGILYPTIKQAGHPRWALWGTSVVFGLLHANMAAFVPLVFLAVVLTFLYEASDSLLTPIATHCMFNAVNYVYVVFEDPINRLLHIS